MNMVFFYKFLVMDLLTYANVHLFRSGSTENTKNSASAGWIHSVFFSPQAIRNEGFLLFVFAFSAMFSIHFDKFLFNSFFFLHLDTLVLHLVLYAFLLKLKHLKSGLLV